MARFNRNQYEIARRARIVAEVDKAYPNDTTEERAAIVEDWIADEFCDFCKEPFTEENYATPEEGGAWACLQCANRFARQDRERAGKLPSHSKPSEPS